jgi:hypothetical protein
MSESNPQELTNEETLAELEQYQDMFTHPGWQKFIETNKKGLQKQKDTAHEAYLTNDEWQYARGVISTLERLVNFQLAVENGIDAVNERIAEENSPEEPDEYPL